MINIQKTLVFNIYYYNICLIDSCIVSQADSILHNAPDSVIPSQDQGAHLNDSTIAATKIIILQFVIIRFLLPARNDCQATKRNVQTPLIKLKRQKPPLRDFCLFFKCIFSFLSFTHSGD